MMRMEQQKNRERVKAAVAVGALHALLAYAFISGLAFEVAEQAGESLNVFDVTEPPQPPPPPEEASTPDPSPAPRPEAAAAPESTEAVVVPEPEVWFAIAPNIQTAPAAGTGDVPGPGTGSGGEGTGTGSGSEGSGTGGGGTGARRVSGALVDSDYPRSAAEARAAGTVHVRFTVRTDGRVDNCVVTRSSGHADLDRTTCRLIERRFRYSPARDAAGKPVTEVVTTEFYWSPRFVD